MTAVSRFSIINEVMERSGNLLSAAELCRLAKVSRSGYYRWLGAAPKRQELEESDAKDFQKVLQAYEYRGYRKGTRSIHMRLLHTGVLMNVKKIRRLMNKYGLRCPFRGANPYRRLAMDLKTDTVFPNVVDRKFLKGKARKVLLTDITYLRYNGTFCYLSTILDAFTREILAYQLSDNLKVDFVLNTVDELTERYGCELDNTTTVHSDQGCHYTSYAFIAKIKDSGFVQSMSRKGQCWDNAPQESFFGHMKDEIMFYVKMCSTYEEVQARIDDWIDYYNNDRYHWDLAKLSPKEYYTFITTGYYPLPIAHPSRGSAPDPEV